MKIETIIFICCSLSCIFGFILYEKCNKKISNIKQETYLVEHQKPVCTNYVHIPPWNVNKKICRVKTITVEEKHQIYITNETPPQILHCPSCKFCKSKLDEKQKSDD